MDTTECIMRASRAILAARRREGGRGGGGVVGEGRWRAEGEGEGRRRRGWEGRFRREDSVPRRDPRQIKSFDYRLGFLPHPTLSAS